MINFTNDPPFQKVAIKEKDRSKDAERLILGLKCCGAAGEGVSVCSLKLRIRINYILSDISTCLFWPWFD